MEERYANDDLENFSPADDGEAKQQVVEGVIWVDYI